MIHQRNIMFEQQICAAITGKRIVRLAYTDELTLVRVFHPYVVFESTQEKILVGGWQVKKDDELFLQPEWRLFEIANINSLAVLTNTDSFNPDPAFSSYDSKEYGNKVLCAVDRR